MAKKGHNLAKDMILSTIQRVEKLEEEKAGLSADIREVFQEAKGNGLDTKVLRALIKLRKQDADERAEFNATLGIYGEVVGIDPFS